jgi:hypothetical protein
MAYQARLHGTGRQGQKSMYLGEWAYLVLAKLPGYGLDKVAAGGEGDDGEGCAQHTQLLRRAQDVLHRDILEKFKTSFIFYSVGDPDPYVFGPLGSASGSVSNKYGYESVSGSFHHHAKKPCILLFFNFFMTFYFYGSKDPDPY